VSKKMTVKEIVQTWLTEHGYDGLCCEDCGCGGDIFMDCCSEGIDDCQPAYRHVAQTQEEADSFGVDIGAEYWSAKK